MQRVSTGLDSLHANIRDQSFSLSSISSVQCTTTIQGVVSSKEKIVEAKAEKTHE